MTLTQDEAEFSLSQLQKQNIKERKARLIAFYLPQFHPIPENDEWWSKGFTEWTNVTKAKPLFPGHHQPNLPAELGFYDLRVPEVREAQAELAREHGIEGFCYWHYWFGNGRRLLERPFNEVLKSGKPDFPFCLGWANQTWTGIWHGCTDRVLIEQTYPGIRDYENHFYAILEAFFDNRYLKIDEKPIFLIYRHNELPDAKVLTSVWQELANKVGLKGIYFIAILHGEPLQNPKDLGFDAVTFSNLPKIRRYETVDTISKLKFIKKKAKKIVKDFISRRDVNLSSLAEQIKYLPSIIKDDAMIFYRRKINRPIHIYSYQEVMQDLYFLEEMPPIVSKFPCVISNWDNTPRSGINGLVLYNSTPELFQVQVRQAIQKVIDQPTDQKIVFIKSWNEWAEGNYIEPDLKYGRAYLEAIRDEVFCYPIPNNYD